MQVAVAVNGRVDLESGMVAYYGNPLGNVQTLHLSGAKMLQAGNTLSLWWKSGNDRSYNVRTETSFGAQYLGSDRLGFSADLTSSVTRTVCFALCDVHLHSRFQGALWLGTAMTATWRQP